MARLTDDQLTFLRAQKIPLGQLFDASGWRKPDYEAEMKRRGQNFAFGTTPCSRSGHTLRTRHGHCIQCDTSKIAYQMRHSFPGFVYVAGSYSTGLLKVGSTGDLHDRMSKIREYHYGGAGDWELLIRVSSPSAGRLEFAVQDRLRAYSVPGSYMRAGKTQSCYELYRCSYQVAKAAVLEAAPETPKVILENDARSSRLWNTPTAPSARALPA